jgi:hypothetical protein
MVKSLITMSRTLSLSFLALLAVTCAVTCFPCSPCSADEGLNLRDKITDFSKSANQKRWKIEDRIVQRERDFQDGIMEEWREAIQKGLDQIKQAPDWKQAQRANRDQMRAVVADLRQKIRVHREEFQLSFLATTNELEKDLKDFLSPIEQEFKKNKSEAYQKAEGDFESARDELKDDLHAWRDRVKELRTPDTIIPY